MERTTYKHYRIYTIALIALAGAALVVGCNFPGWSGPNITPLAITDDASTWEPSPIGPAGTTVPTLQVTEVATPFLQETALPDICQYRVASGDTLWQIAQDFGTTVGEIQSESGVTDPGLIYVGQMLSIPGGHREGCLTEFVATENPVNGEIADFSRAPLADAYTSGWKHGDDENAPEYDEPGCPSRAEGQACLHPGYDISSSDYTVRANTAGVVRLYQTYRHPRDGIITVEYDPNDPIPNEDLEWFGNYAVLESTIGGDTYYQVFAHMDSFPEGMDSGDTVEAGASIGTMDSTGNSTGDHVHWEVRTEDGYETSAATGNFAEFYPDSSEELDEDFVDPLAFEELLP